MEKHIIVDTTQTVGKPYIDINGENTDLIENADVFESKLEAESYINYYSWNNWAIVEPLSKYK